MVAVDGVPGGSGSRERSDDLMESSPRRCAVWWLPLAFCVTAWPAYAEEAAAVSSAATELDTVHSVAKRLRRGDVQAPPSTVTTLEGDELQQERIDQIEDLQDLVPGLQIDSVDPYETYVSLRGLSDGNDGEINIGLAGSVASYLDNIYLSRAGMIPRDLVDVDYVRVLSGPQGTLFGINTGGGVIDLHTKQPTFVPEGSLRQSFGQNGYVQTRAVASGPLGGHWAGRVSASRTENDGYVHNIRNGHTLGGSRSVGIRGQLLYQPSDDFSLKLAADYSKQTGNPVQSFYRSTPVDGVNSFLAKAAVLGFTPVFGDKVELDRESRYRLEQGGGSVEALWQLDSGHQVRAVTGLRYFGYQPNAADRLPVSLYDTQGTRIRDRVWSQDLRLESPRGAFFDYVLGYTYQGQSMDTLAKTNYDDDYPTIYYGNTSYTGLSVVRWGKLNEQLHSVFGQGTFHLGDAWDLVAGLRYTYERKSGSFRRANRAAYNSGWLVEYYTLPSAIVNLNHRIGDHLTAYAGASYSEKSGGLNISAGAARALKSTDTLFIEPESTRSAELGIKADWPEQRLNLATALFWTEVRNFQTNGYDEENDISYLTNAGDIRTRGVEAALRFSASERLQLNLGATYLDATYLRYPNGSCPAELGADAPVYCDHAGERIVRAPKWTYNVRARYGWQLANGWNAFVSGRYSYRSWFNSTLDNSVLTRVPGYGLLSFNAGLDGERGNGHAWSASVWVKNVLDKHYFRTLRGGGSEVYGALGEPRTLGVSVEYRY